MAFNQFSTLESSRLIFYSKIVILVENMLSIASSANKMVLNDEAKGKSLINSKKRSDPKVDPCGILIFYHAVFTLFTVVYCLWSVRQLLSNFKGFALNPKSSQVKQFISVTTRLVQ